MSDLNKLMEKLKKEKPVKTTPEEKEQKIEELDDDEDKEDQLPQETKPIPTPSNIDIDEPNPIEEEVAILQNNGIFRRELISSIRELVDVMKVNTQALLDIKKIAGGDDGKKN